MRSLEKPLLVIGTLLALILAGLASPSANAEPAQAGPLCDARNAVLASLNGNFAEKPTSMGLTKDGTIIEVLSSEMGSWSIIMTMPNGVSCLMATGNYWQKLMKKTAEQKL